MNEHPCTVEEAAAMTFEPMHLDHDEIMSRADFLERASTTYLLMAVGSRLLTKGPSDIADVLLEASPEEPDGILEELLETREWLEGIANVLACVESRVLVALSQRAMQS